MLIDSHDALSMEKALKKLYFECDYNLIFFYELEQIQIYLTECDAIIQRRFRGLVPEEEILNL